MKKITLAIAIFLFSYLSYSQSNTFNYGLQSESKTHELYVSIEKNSDKYSFENNAAFKLLQEEFSIQIFQGISISEAKLNELESKAIALTGSGESVQKLRNIWRLSIENPTNERLIQLAEKLEKLSSVKYCSLVSLEPIKPPADIPPTTTNYEPNQTYIGPNPGVNMTYAWGIGLTGSGINFRDVEYGFNKNHEELNDRNIFLAPGMDVSSNASVSYTEHGTAVLGIVFGNKGTYGISGMAYGANGGLLFPEWQQSGYNRINAVTQAISNSVAGDIIMYEMQTTGGANSYFVPAEYNQVIWNLTKAATDAGIIIVAAAGNGSNTIWEGEDLDAPANANYMSRGDSGAIIVGAGTANMAHNRLGFSTYGARVDVQAWGQNVLSSGYGDYAQIGGDFNQYYTNFSGTSSATPLVASCAIVLQSYYHVLTGNYMTSQEMRTLLKTTGIPQGSGVAGNIGPIPNMQTAISKLQSDFLSVTKNESIEFIVYPNPVDDKLVIKTKNLSSDAKAEIHNSLGQLIYSSKISEESTIDLVPFSKGIYFVKVSDNGKTQVKKIIKK